MISSASSKNRSKKHQDQKTVNDPKAVKPRDGEVFVSRILKIQPEGVIFRKPVTVLFSHSLYEDQVFLDFYELIVENLSTGGCQELKTERISFMKGNFAWK